MYKLSIKYLMRALNLGLLCLATVCHAEDPLPSWNEGAVKSSIINFVNTVTDEEGENYIVPAARIATFDQDGTLWVEQPFYPQWYFTIDRLAQIATSPFSKLDKMLKGLIKKVKGSFDISKQELTAILGIVDVDISVDNYHSIIKNWMGTAQHPDFKKPFTALIYQPMLEVIHYLQKNNFKTYIVSGGGQEFIRAYAENFYQIPPDCIIGSAIKVKYEYEDGKVKLLRTPDVLFVNEKEGKAEAINLIIGRKPIAAFGNSDGDRQMLELTWVNKGLSVLIHHDDSFREYAYDNYSKVGKLTKDFMAEAQEREYQIVSMKKDWNTLFSWQTTLPPIPSALE